MKLKICFAIALAAGMARAEDGPAKKPDPKKKSTPPAELTLPAGAVMVEPGTYTFTDAQGKKWIYRKTPFGLARLEDKPADSAAAAAPTQPPATTPAAAPAQPAAGTLGGLNFDNASLVAVIDILAQKLKINYILDPKVNGKVTINTYGEIKPVDVRQLLDTILRINNAVMVKVGDLYRIVPAADAVKLPISPRVAGGDLPNDEEVVLNLVFLKYASVNDMKTLIDPFLGEGKT